MENYCCQQFCGGLLTDCWLVFQDILSNSSIDIRLQRKAVFLVGDLAESQIEAKDAAELPFFSNSLFLKSVVDLMASPDLDLQEKVLISYSYILTFFFTCFCYGCCSPELGRFLGILIAWNLFDPRFS